MNRRKILAMLGLAPLAAVAAPKPEEKTVPLLLWFHPDKKKTYRDLYWEAQAHIQELEGPSLSDRLKAKGFKPFESHATIKAEGMTVVYDE